MATYKKKDFKKIKSEDLKVEDENIDELVDADGSELDDGDDIDNISIANSEIQTGPTLPYDRKGKPTTTRDHEKSAIQPRRFYGIDGTPYSHGGHGIAGMYEGENIDEIAREKMRKMVEDLVGKNGVDSEMVRKNANTDVSRNQIPDIDQLNQAVANKATELLGAIENSELSEDEVGILLNYIISNIDTNRISPDYKNLIKRNI